VIRMLSPLTDARCNMFSAVENAHGITAHSASDKVSSTA
jgi:hypothetical protein